MLVAVLIIMVLLLILLLFIIYVLALGVGAYGEYVKENHLEQPSGEELRRLMKQYIERR